MWPFPLHLVRAMPIQIAVEGHPCLDELHEDETFAEYGFVTNFCSVCFCSAYCICLSFKVNDGTAAGIYAIRRLKIKRCGEHALRLSSRLVILSENPYNVPSESIKDIKAEGLILGGRPYESAVRPSHPASGMV